VAIGRQSLVIAPDVRAFREGVASARTFARKHEIAALQAAGLSKGGSLDNAIVVDGDKVLNPGGLRFADEFVRHKALDLMGDLYMAGPILGKVTTFKGGHGLNHERYTSRTRPNSGLNTVFNADSLYLIPTLTLFSLLPSRFLV